MTGPSVRRTLGLRSLSDKDATDRLTADDHIKQVKEIPVPANQAKLDSDDDFKMISTR